MRRAGRLPRVNPPGYLAELAAEVGLRTTRGRGEHAWARGEGEAALAGRCDGLERGRRPRAAGCGRRGKGGRSATVAHRLTPAHGRRGARACASHHGDGPRPGQVEPRVFRLGLQNPANIRAVSTTMNVPKQSCGGLMVHCVSDFSFQSTHALGRSCMRHCGSCELMHDASTPETFTYVLRQCSIIPTRVTRAMNLYMGDGSNLVLYEVHTRTVHIYIPQSAVSWDDSKLQSRPYRRRPHAQQQAVSGGACTQQCAPVASETRCCALGPPPWKVTHSTRLCPTILM